MMLKQLAYIKAPGKGSVYGRLFSSTGEVFKTPRNWLGRTVRFYAVDGSGRLLTHSTPDITVNPEAVSEYNVSTLELIPAPDAAPLNLKDWSFTDIIFAKDVDLYFGVFGVEDGVGYWYAHISDHGGSVGL